MASWGSSRSDKAMLERLDSIIKQASRDSPHKKLAETDGPLAASTWNPTPSTYRLGNGAALIVQHGVFEVVGGLNHVRPSVYYDPDRNVICVFQGYLSNLDELIERYASPGEDPSCSPTTVSSQTDPREAAAALLCSMWSRGEEPLIILSELQGQYAFAVVDSEKRSIFAARDSTGKEPLFCELTDDGAISLSNASLSVAAVDGLGTVEWIELLPGHYIAGKTPKVQQYALTTAQLAAREYYDTLEEELACSPHSLPSSGRRSLSDELADTLGISD